MDNMTAKRALSVLRQHNEWRRGATDEYPDSAKELGEAIDFACSVLSATRVPDVLVCAVCDVAWNQVDPKECVHNTNARHVGHQSPCRPVLYTAPPTPGTDELDRLRERVAELEAALEPDMFWWADDPEHPAADDLDGLCDMIFDDSLSPSDGSQLAKVRLAASLPDAVLEAKVVERDGDFYWESRLREGGE